MYDRNDSQHFMRIMTGLLCWRLVRETEREGGEEREGGRDETEREKERERARETDTHTHTYTQKKTESKRECRLKVISRYSSYQKRPKNIALISTINSGISSHTYVQQRFMTMKGMPCRCGLKVISRYSSYQKRPRNIALMSTINSGILSHAYLQQRFMTIKALSLS